MDPFNLLNEVGMSERGFHFQHGWEYVNYMRALSLVYPEGMENVDEAELEPKKIFSQITCVQLNTGAKSWAKSGKIDALKLAYTNLFKKDNDLLLLLGRTAGLSILYVDKDKTTGCGYL